jgi:hypothetical protein
VFNSIALFTAERNSSRETKWPNQPTDQQRHTRKTRNSGARKKESKEQNGQTHTDTPTSRGQPTNNNNKSLSLSNAIGISPESPRRCWRLLPIGPIGDTHMHPLHVRQGAAAAVGLFF